MEGIYNIRANTFFSFGSKINYRDCKLNNLYIYEDSDSSNSHIKIDIFFNEIKIDILCMNACLGSKSYMF